MKLIDILIEETIKNGWSWPKRANCITQDSDREIVSTGCHPDDAKFCYYRNGWNLKASRIESFESRILADDYTTAIITREQYEAALAAKDDGWIEWGGGECPVPRGTLVDVRYRDGKQLNALSANYGTLNPRDASFVFWLNHGCEKDIIAYRLHQPQEAEQAKADDENNLNECIGQGAAQAWNGEGLPPVGCVCEWQDKNTKQWQPVKVVYSSEWVTVIREINKERGDDLVEIAIENYGDDARLKFRPIRSAEDEKRDDMASAIDGFISGFRGQEAGSNKELAYAITDYLALLDKI